jgi:hypothetical protein
MVLSRETSADDIRQLPPDSVNAVFLAEQQFDCFAVAFTFRDDSKPRDFSARINDCTIENVIGCFACCGDVRPILERH